MTEEAVKNGIDNLEKYKHLFTGKRLGLVTNHTGLNRGMKASIDLLKERYNLTALYAPEHGLKGTIQAGEAVETHMDEHTGLPVYSLYGSGKKPAPEVLCNIDTLVFDIQDIGSRYYTFISTMALAMESCAENNKAFVVLDRVNPIGDSVEGNVINHCFKSFVGMYAIPIRHGLTIGELARLINSEYHIGGSLEVIPIEGWKREMYFDETGLHWVNPTPNMTSVEAAVLYAGTCLFEGTNVSEGRGTRPFEIIGAPWIDPHRLAGKMNEIGLKGVIFRPASFIPMFSKHQGETCGGVQLHITDRAGMKPVECGIMLMFTIKELYPDQFLFFPSSGENGHPFIDLLAGTDRVRKVKDATEARQMMKDWKKECGSFLAIREKYKLYR